MKKLMLAFAAVAAMLGAKAELPTGYTALPYVKTTGKQWVDLGIPLKSTYQVEMDFELTSIAKGLIYGSRESATSKNFAALLDQSLGICIDYSDHSKSRLSYNVVVNTRYFITNRSDLRELRRGGPGGAVVLSDTRKVTTEFDCGTRNCYLFSLNRPSSQLSGYANMSGYLFSFKITDLTTGEIVRDLVPCKRTNDGVIGLYDAQGNGGFYSSQGTEAFEGPGVAPDPEPIPAHPDVVIDNEVIETNRFVCEDETVRIGAPSTLIISGANTGLRNTSVDVETKSATHSATTCAGAIGVFGCPNGGDHLSRMAVYSLKIWQNGNLVRDFVPCRRLSDGVGGLYDLVDHAGEKDADDNDIPQFRSNVKAEDFIMPTQTTGEAPAEGYERLAWIRADGNHIIDTGFTPDSNTKIEVVFNSWLRNINTTLVGYKWDKKAWLFALNGQNDWAFFDDTTDKKLYNAADYTDYRVTITSSKVTCEPLAPVSAESLAAAFSFGNSTVVGESAKEMTVANGTGIDLTSGQKIALFCDVNSSYSSRGSTIYFYSMKIWDGDTLVRDFVPCRELTGPKRAGLYDIADHADDPAYYPFYTTHGPIAFETPVLAEGENPADGYERLAWIKSNGNQMIDTGIKGGETIRVEFCYNSASPIQDGKILFGGTFATKQYMLAECANVYKFFGATDKTSFAATSDTDYLVTVGKVDETATITAKKLSTTKTMPVVFAPSGMGFAAAPIQSTSAQRGIALYDGTEIVVSDTGLSSGWGKIPLMYDAGGFAQTPLTEAKLTALEACATLPKGAKLVYDETKKTLYCKRRIGLIIAFE